MKTRKTKKVLTIAVVAVALLSALAITAFAESYNNLQYDRIDNVSFDGGEYEPIAVFYTTGDDNNTYYEYCVEMGIAVEPGINYDGEDFKEHLGENADKIRAILKYSPANGKTTTEIMSAIGINETDLADKGFTADQVTTNACNAAAQAAIWSTIHYSSTRTVRFDGTEAKIREYIFNKYMDISGIAFVSSGDLYINTPENQTIVRKETTTYTFEVEITGTLTDQTINISGGSGTVSMSEPTVNGDVYTYTLTIVGGAKDDVYNVEVKATGLKPMARVLVNTEGIQKHATIRKLPYSETASFDISLTDPTLTFYDGYENTISSGSQMAGSTIQYPSDTPIRDGYRFIGWDSDVTTMPETDLTISAQWSPDPQMLTYYKNDGETPEETALQTPTPVTDEDITLADNTTFEREGYELVGWSLVRDTTADYDCGASYTMPAEYVNLYAVWEKIPISVSYDGNGSTGGTVPTDSKTYYIGDTATVKADDDVSSNPMVRDGYTFETWNTQDDGFGKDRAEGSTFTIPGTDVVLYAQWKADDQTLIYNKNDGTDTPETTIESYKTDEKFNLAGEGKFTREGYTLMGWTDGIDKVEAKYRLEDITPDYALGEAYIMPAKAVTMFALWKVNKHDVFFEENGGTEVSDKEGIEYGALVPTANETKREGYTFVGWFDEELKNEWVFSSDTMPDSDLKLYAKWSRNTYTLSYDGGTADSGSVDSQNGLYEAKLIVKANGFSKYGYTFLEWNTEQDGSGMKYEPDDEFVIPAANTVLYAQWKENGAVVLRYDGNLSTDGSVGSQSGPHSTEVSLRANGFERIGYDFEGWNTESDGSGKYYAEGDSYTLPVTDSVLYAQWTRHTYTVTYLEGSDGTLTGDTSEKVLYEEAPENVPTVTSATGRQFIGWSTDGGSTLLSTEQVLTTPILGDTTYTAYYQMLTYTVRFYEADRLTQIGVTQVVDWDEAATIETAPEVEGTTFAGWDVTGDNDAEDNSFDNVRENLVAVASYNDVLYVVRFVDEDGTVYGTDTVLYGGSATAPSDPEKADYTFDGWDVPFNYVTSNLTVTAQFTSASTPTATDELDVTMESEKVGEEGIPRAESAAVRATETLDDEGVAEGDMDYTRYCLLCMLWLLLGLLGVGLLLMIFLWRNVIVTYHDKEGKRVKKRVRKKLKSHGKNTRPFVVVLDDLKDETIRVSLVVKKRLTRKISEKEVRVVIVKAGERVVSTTEVPIDIDDCYRVSSISII